MEALCARLRETLRQLFDGARLLAVIVIVAVEHFLESPLRPVVILRVASADFAAPVEGEAYLVQLFAVAVDIVDGCNCRVLYGILLGGQSVSVIAHGIQHVEALEAFISGVDVRSDVAQRMSHVQPRPAGIGEHVEDIIFLFAFIFLHAVGLVVHPSFLPFLFNFPEIIFHIGFL